MKHNHHGGESCKLPQTEPCAECGALICYEEYIVCWGFCDTCLNRSLEEYERRRAQRERSESF